MRLTVFAATGGIGHHVVEQALASGHEVTAVVRDPLKLSIAEVRTVVVDLSEPDPAALQSAVAGTDAVLSGVGPRAKSEDGIASRGTLAIVRAMHAAGVHRLVVVSAALVGNVPSPGRPRPPRHDPGDGFFMRHLLSPIATRMQSAHMADLASMEDIVRDSGLEWTIVRPPQLTDKPMTGTYRTAYGQNLKRGLHVSRADVAHLMLRTLDQPGAIGKVIGVAD